MFKGTKIGVIFQPAGADQFCKSVYSAGAAAHTSMTNVKGGELPGSVLAGFIGRKRICTFYL